MLTGLIRSQKSPNDSPLTPHASPLTPHDSHLNSLETSNTVSSSLLNSLSVWLRDFKSTLFEPHTNIIIRDSDCLRPRASGRIPATFINIVPLYLSPLPTTYGNH